MPGGFDMASARAADANKPMSDTGAVAAATSSPDELTETKLGGEGEAGASKGVGATPTSQSKPWSSSDTRHQSIKMERHEVFQAPARSHHGARQEVTPIIGRGMIALPNLLGWFTYKSQDCSSCPDANPWEHKTSTFLFTTCTWCGSAWNSSNAWEVCDFKDCHFGVTPRPVHSASKSDARFGVGTGVS